MKKLLSIGIIAAAGMLLAVSCSNDDLDSAVSSGDECLVTFTLEQPGISTRAYSDGTTATTLTYAVYEKDSKLPLITSEDIVTFSDKKATVSFSLVKGSSYDIIFWADAPVSEGETNPYTFSAADQTITIDYSGVSSQDESRDAFYASRTLEEISGPVSETIYLYRPFAQLNIGTTDLTEASAAGFTPTKSTVTISNVYNTLNLLDGTVSGGAEVTYAEAAIPSGEAFPVSVDGTTITYLSMNYLLVDSEKEIVDVEFTVNNDGNTETSHSIPLSFNSVPVQRNYRTNIYGALLTDPANFTIVIAPDYETPDYIVPEYVADATELAAALADSEICEIALSADMTISSETSITTDKTIDLNGNTLTTKYESSYGDLVVYEDATLTIQNGTITQENGTSLICEAGSAIVLDGVTYSGAGWSCIFNDSYATDTQITVRNSTITGGYYALFTNASASSGDVGYTNMTLENSTFIADETALVINTPSTLTATDCTFQGGWQAAFLRGGTSSFTNCAFNLVMNPAYNDVPEDHNNANGTWKDGNQAVTAALLIGNRGAENSTAYNYPTTVTMEKCKFSVSGTAYHNNTEYLTTAPSVYIWSRVETGNGTTITYDADSYTSFEAAGSGSYVGNSGTNLTVNGSSYSEAGTSLPAVN